MRNGQNKRMRNRNRKGQNPMTRVYESNGPDVKIRGTASHIAEKYVQLARDALGSGDPVSAENYYQHAEHYFRIIASAQEQFRQSQPYPRNDSDMRDDDGEGEGESYGSFGSEPYAPREQQAFQPREQQAYPQRAPQPQVADDSDIDRLPSFITGGQGQGGASSNGDEPRGNDRFSHRRRRRHHTPRNNDAGGTGQAAGGDEFAPGAAPAGE